MKNQKKKEEMIYLKLMKLQKKRRQIVMLKMKITDLKWVKRM